VARAFLTGGSGFLGGALLEGLLERGDSVTALARSDAAAAALADKGVYVARGDTLDEDALAAGMRGCDIVYHVAGMNTMCPEDPVEMIHVNVRGAEAAVRAAARAGIKRLVLTSSAASLGEERGTIGNEDSPHRGWYMSVYERSKREGEVAALAAGERDGVEVVSVNPSSVQGPGRAGGTGRIMIAYLNGKLRAFVHTNISIVDIRDCVAGHLLAADIGRPGERYVLNGVTLESSEALEIVAGMTGVVEKPAFLPPAVAQAAATAVEGGFKLARKHPPVCRAMVRTMLHGHRYDGSRATRDLGLQYTDVRDTFARTIEWAISEGLVKRPLPEFSATAPGRP
jgi:dihydroflavonol-4-reductase